MEKRYNYRIYPTKKQQEQIQKNFGCVRFVYNHFLSKRIHKYKAGEGFYSYYDACKDLTKLKKQDEYSWLCEADSHSLQTALKNMDHAYSDFFRRVREKNGAPGFPHYKKKSETRQSYTSHAQPGRNTIYLEGDRKIRLPKLGLVACRVSRIPEGRILSASVFQVPSGKYFVSVCCTDVTAEPFAMTGKEIGLHFGIKTLITTSEGQSIDNNRYMERTQKKLLRLHRRLSRKPSGSANRKKARIALAKTYEHIRNQKIDNLHKLTRKLVLGYDTICVRNEQVAKMVRKRSFAYYLSDASWGELVKLLQYKCHWYGKVLVKVEESFPSVQLCSLCNCKNTKLIKSQSLKWICPKCGAIHERAKNAAVNTLNHGLHMLHHA